MTPEDVRLLVSPAGDTVLTAAGQANADGADPLVTSARLRRDGHDPHLVALAQTQARLRAKAVVKLGERGAAMLWTADAVEQASRAEVAAHRAARLAAALPSGARVADLCCGAGADLLALADAGLSVLAVDLDPVVAAVAAANVTALGLDGRVEVRCDDAGAVDPVADGCAGAYVDPARRADGRRTFDPRAYSPPLSYVSGLAARLPTVAKLAPGIAHEDVPGGVEAEWVSVAGELKEAVLWYPPLATDGVSRRATLLPSGAQLTDGDLPGEPPPVGAVGGWLVEPDAAVIRAGLVAAVVARCAGRLLDAHVAYVVCDSRPPATYGRVFAVLAELPFAIKRLRAALREREYGDVVVKKRGVAVLPEELRRRLALGGDGPIATLVLTRTDTGPLALLVQPL